MADAQKNHKTRSRLNSSKKGKTGDDNKVLCGKCDKELCDDEIQCEICEFKYHRTCIDLNKGKYDAIILYEMHWYCKQCEIASSKILHTVAALQNDITKVKADVEECQNNIAKCVQTTTMETELLRVREEFAKFKEDFTADINNRLTEAAVEAVTQKDEFTTEINNKINEAATDAAAQTARFATDITTKLNEAVDGEEDEDWQTVINRNRRNRGNKDLQADINEALEEKARIEKRKLNLIAQNIKEPTQDSSDIDKIKDIIRSRLNITDDITITDTTRLGTYEAGKDRLLRFTLENMKMKKLILSKAVTLRNLAAEDDYYKVYIKPDLTPKQVEESKNLVKELKKLRLAAETEGTGKLWKIHRGKVVEVDARGRYIV